MIGILILFSVVGSSLVQSIPPTNFSVPPKFSSIAMDDAELSLLELIRRYNYTVEDHAVQTEDGYLLSLYRIVDSPKRKKVPRKTVPVLLAHGLCGSAATFLVMGPSSALGKYCSKSNIKRRNIPFKHLIFTKIMSINTLS